MTHTDFNPAARSTQPVTSLRDVAAAAAVSVSTASRVLSGSSHPVSEETRIRVLAAADRLRFEPNRLARALATARSQTIGVVVHDVSDPYFAEMIRGLEDVAGPRNHALFVSSSDRDPHKELAVLRAFVANQVDAIVLAASALTVQEYVSEMAALLSRFEENGGVVVAIAEQNYPNHRVRFDHIAGTRQAMLHLIEQGHRRIAYLAGPTNLEVSSIRLEGYRSSLEEHGLEYEPDLVECGWFSMEGGALATAALVERGEFTAIVAANDLMAIGALSTLRDRHLSVPEDMSVVGFDDIEFSAYAPVPLTTVRMPLAELGRAGAGLVLDLLDGKDAPAPQAVPAELVVRESTGPVPPLAG